MALTPNAVAERHASIEAGLARRNRHLNLRPSGRTGLAEGGDRRGERGQRLRPPGTGGDDHHVLDPERRGRLAPPHELLAGLPGLQPGAERLLHRLVGAAGVLAVAGPGRELLADGAPAVGG